MKNILISSLSLLSGLCLASDPTDKQTMIVFDGSGSMWGQIDGQAKITTAQQVMAKISGQFQSTDAIGLMAYGHRKKGDCGDIELLLPVARNQSTALIQQVQSIKPKGKTPIGAALKMATDQLKIAEQAAEVILISDGLETCHLDPCQVATDAEALGIDFTAHVIGFGLSQDQGKQLACVADITGGQYLAAENAEDLTAALNQVLTEPETEPVSDALPTATINAPQTWPTIGTTFSVEWTGPNGKHDYIDIVKPNDNRVYGELSYSWAQDGQPAQLKAPGTPGQYQLRYIWQGQKKKHVLAAVDLEVKDSEVSLIAPVKVSAGEGFDVSWTGPNQPGDYVDLVKAGDIRAYGELSYFYTEAGKKGQLLAPANAGEYDIRYILEAADGRKVLHRIPILVETAVVTLSAPPEVEIGQSFDVFWNGPVNKDGYIDLVKRGDIRTYGEFSYFYLKDHPENGELKAHVIAGEYDVRFIMIGSDGRQIMATQPINILPVEVTLDAPDQATVNSPVMVEWQGPSRKGDYIDLAKHNSKKPYGELSYFYTKDNQGKGQLNMPKTPGTYTIRYIIQGKSRQILATKDITVK
ncbi:vWA domain-containing protein [Marinicella rhabdoformis]|uniref:vWA domain-containing protein n=1 Tax=Marinicella rhabdoformis TaxID=2580566 RepID=UPI0012AED2BE|nr:VWA domain-containing protein [Marinicella rhabdoformis]